MKTFLQKCKLILPLLLLAQFAVAQSTAPKLVVGLVVDQMRWDYLYRYSSRYGADGFKRLLREGFSMENAFIPYLPTYTAAGHACVYTGSVPSLHGILGNAWYSKDLGRVVYCVEDNSVQGVGSTSAAGRMSPKNLWSTTITDELRMANNFRNKTISIALKDRGSILPGGHTSNGSYWFDNASGGFISSTFYMQALPDWVTQFNARKLPDAYLKQNWTTLYPINTYVQSTADDKGYESNVPGSGHTFPYKTDTLAKNKYDVFRYVPFANTYTIEMAKAAIEGERLGKSGFTDFLAVSFSTPDYIGHSTGPNSIEVEDTYLRLDKDLGQFLKYLDATIGKGEYLVFLTADHGAAQVPGFLKENKIPAGVLDDVDIRKDLNDAFKRDLNVEGLISSVMNYQVFLNDAVLAKNKLDKKIIKRRIVDSLLKYPAIAKAFDTEELANAALPGKVKNMLVQGYNQKLSGDVLFVFKPQYFDGWEKGTSHGVWNPYDAHIPLLWFGWKIKPGKSNREVYMTDIAPTLAALLQVQMPNASIGDVMEEVVK